MNKNLVVVITICLVIICCDAVSKYSAEANQKNDDNIHVPSTLRELDKPFRMAKLNLLWSKAKHRLTNPKLQSLFSDLKIHDKEEIAFKHLKADGQDVSGLEEAKMRKRLLGIMSTYGLLEHFGETDDPELLKRHKALNDGSNYVAKNVFDDQRLDKLWAKAEMAGFTHEELEALKEEFTHHQDKVDEYKSLLKEIESGDPQMNENSLHDKPTSWNELDQQEETNDIPTKKLDYLEKATLLREKHLELRNGYENIEQRTAQGPSHKEFIEPKVQGLWKVAQQAKFSTDELASLKEELLHYETRLMKLRHLQTQAALDAARQGKTYVDENVTTQQHIKKHARTVAKLHLDIENKILARHTEL